ncbi:MAG: sulfatase-like hydrolase/transferase [Verrucomicrobiales bacterium]|nr:sulfatase-like hydrolase/transferase [Verrucomicrobiales bacterium]
MTFPCSRTTAARGLAAHLLAGLTTIGLTAGPGASSALSADSRPNIVLVYADDLGYGDVGCYGATAVATPAIDRLAQEGIRFTDAYAAAATCTPSRYALLTGEYAFRKRGTGVLSGAAGMIIEPGRTTVPSVLQQAGYRTAVVGKWHLGLGDGSLDWNVEIKPGPREIGFDYSFLVPATGDRVPCVYVENSGVVGLDPTDPIAVSYGRKVGTDPIGAEHPELLKMHPSHGHDRTIVNGVSRIGYMTGGNAARWVDEDMADVLTERAVRFIEQNREQPFFLYFAFHDIHVPRLPNRRFVGSTAMGPRGDAIVQADWCVGEILAALDRLGLAGQTLIIFTSDNGPVVDDGYQDQAVERLGAHRPAGVLRGGKYSRFEGGTRVPFLVRWPNRVRPGTSAALVGQVDLLASLARLSGQSLPPDAGPDSQDLLAALLGDSAIGRDHLIEHAGALALREGDWKYLPPAAGATVIRNVNIETGAGNFPQLYDLHRDPGETANLAADYPDRVLAMHARLEQLRTQGSSRRTP